MQKETRIFLGLLVVLAVGLIFFRTTNQQPITGMVVGVETATKEPSNDIRQENTVKKTGGTREFTITAFNYGFSPETILVTQGDIVKLKLSSSDIPHGFAIDEYNISEYLDSKSEKTVEFMANKKGTFTYYCDVPCGSGHGSMRGRLIVK